MHTAKPLAGLKVIDFSMAYAGPICGRMLGDCGADVIKVEPLGFGDGVRGNDRIFTHFNGGKRGVQIDLASCQGQQLAHSLIDTADVLLENYRPGIMARFGLDYESIKTRCPTLVYCSISGFGQSGPGAQRAAFAPIAHAASGYDVAHMRAQIHTQSPADVTMLESMMTLIPGQQQGAQIENEPQLGGFLPITASDGYFMACVVTDKNFEGMCKALDREDLRVDSRFDRPGRLSNVRFLVEEIELWSTIHTVSECEARLNHYGVPCSRYNAPSDLFNEPQLQHRGAFTQATDEQGEYYVQNLPFQFASASNSATPHAPKLGEHTEAVLADSLGLDAQTIAELRRREIVG